MANWEWPSVDDKLEAIGYLAIPGVISAIEPTVPKGKTDQFKEEYEGKYSDEYPYEADKYGKQFRIYLNDTEGCPEFLREHLDGAYGSRINNTQFIDELVRDYGFRFTREQQDSNHIRDCVFKKHSGGELDAFRKGFFSYRNFVDDMESFVKEEKNLAKPKSVEYEERTISRRSEARTGRKDRNESGYTPNQMLKLGWVGEEYVYYLLINRDETILSALNISQGMNYDVTWFNQGFQDAEDEIISSDPLNSATYEKAKKWDDQSVGKGCDIHVVLETGNTVYIEVKTSKRSYPYFNMTSVEMQEMEKRGDQYVLVKVNNIEKLLMNDSPEILAIHNPYEKLFHPKNMKEATFIVGGK